MTISNVCGVAGTCTTVSRASQKHNPACTKLHEPGQSHTPNAPPRKMSRTCPSIAGTLRPVGFQQAQNARKAPPAQFGRPVDGRDSVHMKRMLAAFGTNLHERAPGSTSDRTWTAYTHDTWRTTA